MPIETPSCGDFEYDLLRKILLSLPSIGGGGTTCGFTPTAVIFVGADGCLTEDPTTFFYDSTNNALNVGASRIFTFGANSFYLGDLAGNFTNTGTLNTALGFRASAAVTSGSSNTAIGSNALISNTIGEFITAVGAEALMASTTATRNTAIGSKALMSNTTGFRNTAVGNECLILNTTGFSNAAVGHLTLQSNTIGTELSAFGRAALGSNTTGNNNTAVGFEAGVTLTAANANVTGSNNTFIGYRSGPGSTTQLSNATSLGNRALVTASNSLVLGGIGADLVNVGIGITAPHSRLQTSGAIATPVTTTAISYVVLISDSVILVNATAAPRTVTLPTPVGIAGRRYTVKKIDATANLVTIATAAGTIDGAATKTTAVQYVSFDFVSDGANWFII